MAVIAWNALQQDQTFRHAVTCYPVEGGVNPGVSKCLAATLAAGVRYGAAFSFAAGVLAVWGCKTPGPDVFSAEPSIFTPKGSFLIAIS